MLRDLSSVSTSGGNVWMGGGSGSTIWNDLTVGDGYAVSGTSITPISGGAFVAGIYLERASINSGNGDIAMRAEDAVAGSRRAFVNLGATTINSGTGQIDIDVTTINEYGFVTGMHNGAGGNNSANLVITSAFDDASANAIDISATSSTISSMIVEGTTTISATGRGKLRLLTQGSAGNTGLLLGYSTFSYGILNVLANSGAIELNTGGSSVDISNSGSSGTIGAKAGTSVTSSQSNIEFIADDIGAAGPLNFSTSGQLTMRSSGATFGSTVDLSTLTVSSDLGGLQIGTSTNVSDIILGKDLSLSGPLTLYGNNLSILGNINTSAAGAAGNFLAKASGDIELATTKSITTNGGDVILWANSDGGATHGVVNLRYQSTISTQSGHVWIGGSASDGGSASWNGLTVGDGYAVSGDDELVTGTSNTRMVRSGVYLEGNTITTAGGDIAIYGKTTQSGRGFVSTGPVTINSGTGTILVQAITTNLGGAAGSGWHHNPSIPVLNGSLTLTSASNAATAITWSADASASAEADFLGEGWGAAGTNQFIATGSGGISFTALGSSTQANAPGLRLGYGTSQGGYLNLLSASGDILMNTGAKRLNLANSLTAATIGSKAGTTVTSSTANIEVISDDVSAAGDFSFATSGTLILRPDSSAFSSTVDLSRLYLSSNLGGLQIGTSTNTSNIIFGKDLSIAGSITAFGGDMILNAGVELTVGANENIVLVGSGLFTNQSGANALVVSGSGRWIIYAGDVIGNTYGALNSNNQGVFSKTYSSLAPASVASGNRYVFASAGQQSITFTTTDLSKVYGEVIDLTNAYSISTSGISGETGVFEGIAAGSGGILIGDVFTINPTFSATGAAASSSIGTSIISAASGTPKSGITINYQNTGNLTVTARPITFAANVETKIYGDADPSFSVAVSAGSLASSDSLSQVTGTITREAGANVGLYDILLGTGAKANNYSITFNTDNNGFSITPRTVSLSASKIYDGTADLTVSHVTFGNLAGLETLSLSGALVNDANVTTANKYISAITLEDATDGSGGLATNYQLPTLDANSAPVTITARSLTLTAQAATKVYGDADPAFSYTAEAANGSRGLVTGDVLAGVATREVGEAVAAYAINQGSISNSNYTISWSSNNLAITRKALNVQGFTANDKVYDSTRLATVNSAGTLDGVVGSDDVTFVSSGSVSFDSANAGVAKTVTITGLTLGGSDSANYSLPSTATTLATINPKTVSLSAAKVYDGTTDLSNAVTVSTGVGAETLSYSDALVNAASVSDASYISMITLLDGANGGFERNYQLPTLDATYAPATVTRASLVITAKNANKFVTQADPSGFEGVNYSGFVNGENAAALSSAPSVSRVLTGTTSLDERAGTYVGKLVASGAVADNYTISYVAGDFRIVPADTLVVEASGVSTYGDSVSYTVSSARYVSGENVLYSLSAPTRSGNRFTFSDGSGGSTTFTVTSDGAIYSGSANLTVGVYSLDAANIVSTGSNYSGAVSVVGNHQVEQRDLIVNVSGLSKVYDGSSDMVNLSLSSNAITNDRITLSAQGSYSDKNVSSRKSYLVSNISASGLDVANYSLNISSVMGSTGAISARPLIVAYTGVDKIYDGTSDATVVTSDDRVSGDVFDISRTAIYQSAGIADKQVEAQKSIAVTGAALSGDDAANYALVSTTGSATANITPKELRISGITVADKVYDAATTATVSVDGLSADVLSAGGMVVGDTISVDTVTGTFSDKNAGSDKTVTLSNFTYSGDAANYQIIDQSTAQASITPATLTLAGSTTGVTKVYDGHRDLPSGSSGYGSLVGVLSTPASEQDRVNIVGQAAFSGTIAGQQTIIRNTIALDGVDADNYVLSWRNGTGTITKAPLTIVANDDAKFVTFADVEGYTGVSYQGFVNGETSQTLLSADKLTAPTITRSNAGVETQGTYANVLVPSAATAQNYEPIYVNGDYTIVPADELLVRVANVIHTYGSPENYLVTKASYLDSSGQQIAVLFEDGSDVVGTLSQSGTLNANVNITDAAGGVAAFTLAPASNVQSVSGNVAVGTYSLEATSITETSLNFSSNITVVGSQTVQQRALTLTSAVVPSKAYDGDTSLAADTLTLGLVEKVAGDDLDVGASTRLYANRNAGSNKTYTLSNLALSGNDSGNYYLSQGATQTFANGSITPKSVTLSLASPTVPVSRVYSGGQFFSANADELSDFTTDLGVVGDRVLSALITFDDKNADVNKTIIPSLAMIQDGNNGQNYNVTYVGNATSSITKLSSVTWTGSASDSQWFNPLNWENGAVPDLANVETVILPASASVVFNPTHASGLAEAGTVYLTNIEGGLIAGTAISGQLDQQGGAISLSGDLNLSGWKQSLNSSLSVGGNMIVASASAVTATGVHVISGDLTISASHNDVIINNRQNLFSGLVSIDAQNLNLVQTTGLVLGDVSVADDLTLTTGTGGVSGGISQSVGTIIEVLGHTYLIADSLLNQDAVLSAAGNQFVGSMTFDVANSGSWRDLTISNSSVQSQSVVILPSTVRDVIVNADNSGLRFETVDPTVVSGSLNATSLGDIEQNGALNVLGVVSLDSSSGDIILGDSDNVFSNTLDLEGRDVTLALTGVLQLGTVTLSGDAAFTASDDITQSGPTVISGLANFSSTNGSIALNNAGNDFQGPVSLVATSPSETISVTDAVGDMTLANVASGSTIDLTTTDAGGALTLTGLVSASDITLTSSGSIEQSSGQMSITGTTTATASDDIALDRAANQLSGAVTATGDNVAVATAGDLTADITASGGAQLSGTGDVVVDLTVNGSVAVTSGNDATIRSAQALDLIAEVNGTADLTVAGDLSISASRDLDADISVTGGATTLAVMGNTVLRSASDLQLGGSTTGDLTVTGGGGLSQSSALSVGGDADLQITDDIVLNNASNNFSGAVSGSATRIALTDSSGGLQLGSLTTPGTLDIISSGGDVTQAAGSQLTIGGNVSLSAENSGTPADVILESNGNALSGRVSATGGDVTISATELTFDRVSTSGTFEATAQSGDLTLDNDVSVGALILSSAQGGVAQSAGAVNVSSGPTSLSAATDVILSQANNDFSGTVNASGASIAIDDTNGLTLGAVTSSGAILVSSGGDLALDGPIQGASVGATSTGDLSAGSVTSSGVVTFSSGNDLSLDGPIQGASVGATSTGDLSAGSVRSSSGVVALTANGEVSLSGTIQSATEMTIATQGGISQSAGAKLVSADDLDISAAGNITLNGSIEGAAISANSTTGALSVTEVKTEGGGCKLNKLSGRHPLR
ncbi:YDG domain-containing protein [Alphaproteobacteria bacterium]|nr:YDG domain-containing protein [Alphaproteobacteria bacterium]